MRKAVLQVLIGAALSIGGGARAGSSAEVRWAVAPPPAGFQDTCGTDPACLEPALKAASSADEPPRFDWRGAFGGEDSRRSVRRDTPDVPQESLDGLIALISTVNREVNVQVRKASGGAPPEARWRLPLKDGSRVGDCKAVALEKRRALGFAGLASSRLALAVVLTPDRKTHAVLIVASSAGELVLDSLSPWLMPMSATGYRLIERQAYRSPGAWLKPVVDAQPRPQT